MPNVTGFIHPRHALRDLEMTGIIRKHPELAVRIITREMNIAMAKAWHWDDEDQPDTIGLQEAGVIRRNMME